MLKKYLIFIIVLASILYGSVLNAQVLSTDVSLNISPEFPTPNQEVRATITTYATDLNKAYISWSVNGENLSAGIGKIGFSFNTGNLTQINLTASIETVEGQSLTKSITINPIYLDILWEAVDSYTPPFYKGKSMVVSEGTFKVVAMPSVVTNGQKVSNSNLSYAWKKDNNNQPSASGWGKDYLIFKNSYLDRNNKVEVIVSDISGGEKSKGEIVLTPQSPKVLFYQKDPLLGVKTEHTLDDRFFISEKGETIVAFPYFISPKNLSSNELKFQWILGGIPIANPPKKNEVSVKPETKGGSSNIKVLIENTRALFSGVQNEINVNF